MKDFQSFAEFYPFYLSEHRNGVCRTLHVIGSTSALAMVTTALTAGPLWLLALVPLAGYGPAWVGHFGFEKNKPASFKHPLWSFIGDWAMIRDVAMGRIPLTGELSDGAIQQASGPPA